MVTAFPFSLMKWRTVASHKIVESESVRGNTNQTIHFTSSSYQEFSK